MSQQHNNQHNQHNNHNQQILLPHLRADWRELLPKISEPIKSLVDLDVRICAIYKNKMRSRTIADLFTSYYSDDQWDPVALKFRISQKEFIESIIPTMQQLVLALPKLFKGKILPVLAGSGNIVLSRAQIAAILSACFLGLFGFKYVSAGKIKAADLQDFSFCNIFIHKNLFALQCLMEYFATIARRIAKSGQNALESEIIIIYRKSAEDCADIDWKTSDMPLGEIALGNAADGGIGRVDDCTATSLHVNFANACCCGSMFAETMTYEEILFLSRPEAFVAALICTKMDAGEAIAIFGATKYSSIGGFGLNVRFGGSYLIEQKLCSNGRESAESMIKHTIVCIDPSTNSSPKSQFITDFMRDLAKAYIGFSIVSPEHLIATGNWSQTGYNCNMQLRILQQWLAASQHGKFLIYYAIIPDFESELLAFVDWCIGQDLTVGALFCKYWAVMDALMKSKTSLSGINIFEEIRRFDDE